MVQKPYVSDHLSVAQRSPRAERLGNPLTKYQRHCFHKNDQRKIQTRTKRIQFQGRKEEVGAMRKRATRCDVKTANTLEKLVVVVWGKHCSAPKTKKGQKCIPIQIA